MLPKLHVATSVGSHVLPGQLDTIGSDLASINCVPAGIAVETVTPVRVTLSVLLTTIRYWA